MVPMITNQKKQTHHLRPPYGGLYYTSHCQPSALADQVVAQVSKALKQGTISGERASEILEYVIGVQVEQHLSTVLGRRLGDRLRNVAATTYMAARRGATE